MLGPGPPRGPEAPPVAAGRVVHEERGVLESGAVRLEEVRDLEPARARGGQPCEVSRCVDMPRRAGAGRVGEVEVETQGAEAREGGQDFCDVFLWRCV